MHENNLDPFTLLSHTPVLYRSRMYQMSTFYHLHPSITSTATATECICSSICLLCQPYIHPSPSSFPSKPIYIQLDPDPDGASGASVLLNLPSANVLLCFTLLFALLSLSFFFSFLFFSFLFFSFLFFSFGSLYLWYLVMSLGRVYEFGFVFGICLWFFFWICG